MAVRTSLAFACVLGTVSLLNAQSPKPDRIVRDSTIVSQHDPRVTIMLPKQALYAGADRWILYDVADCELHVFVEADANKVVQRLYWIQFEGYIPSRPELKHNYSDPVQQIQGIDFHVKSHFGGMEEWNGPGSDSEHVQKLLQFAGFIAPKDIMFVRFVHLLDPQMRKELMVIYAENLDSMGIATKDLASGGKSADRWPQLEKELVQRASERIHFSQFTDQ
jgi:hypothetical protein